MEDNDRLRAATSRLAAAGVDDATREARLLAREAPDAAAFERFIARREKREPVAYILGRKEFWSLEFEVTPAVLIPRPDTETIVEIAVKELRETPPTRILDLGTGSGCLLISLLTEFPHATGVGLDISEEALRLAARNAARHGVEARARFLRADFADALREQFDLVVSNPPYIADHVIETLEADVRDHEPHLALKGGAAGLDAIERIARALPSVMSPKALVLIEIGADQGQAATKTLRNAALEPVSIARDLAGHERVVVARLPQRPGG